MLPYLRSIKPYIQRLFDKLKRETHVKFCQGKKKFSNVNRRRKSAQTRALESMKIAALSSAPGAAKLRLPPSPTPRLLTVNDPPTDEEVLLVKRTIQEGKEEQDRLKRKLFLRSVAGHTTRTWEASIRLKLLEASTFIRQHEGILSPLRRLPLELLQEIFLWVGPLTEASGVYLTSSRRYVPWALAQVCQPWRTSALALTSIWSRLPVIRLNNSRDDTAIQSKILRELLRRSGTAPLDLYFHCKRGEFPTYHLLHLLMEHSERWRVVVLHMSLHSLSFLSSIKGKLPLLGSLSMKIHSGGFNSPGQFDMFEVAPRLRKVFVSGMDATLLSLPLTQLVSFGGQRMGRSFHSHVLSPSQPSSVLSLEHLTILEMNVSAASPLPVVTLPRLVKLSVQIANWHDQPHFHHLTLPALQELEYTSSDRTLTANIIPLLSNSKHGAGTTCPLRKLSYRLGLGIHTHPPGDFIDMLSLTPNLVYLDGMFPPCANLLQLANVDEVGTPKIVPHLETCKFFVPQDRKFRVKEARALDAIASARCERRRTWGIQEGASAAHASRLAEHPQASTLKTLLIYYNDTVPAPNLRFGIFLNRHDSDAPLFGVLTELHRNLSGEVPELNTVVENRLRVLDLTWMDRVSHLLDRLDGIQVEGDDIRHVYHSQLHLALKRIQGWELHKNYGFPERCQAILDRWDTLFIAHLVRELRWVFRGQHCIVYLRTDDPIRDSDEDSLNVVYGVPSIPRRDIFWPRYLTHDRYSELDDLNRN